jgi:hypothetical protein
LIHKVLELEVARAAFIRLHDVRAVELVNRTASGLAAGTPKALLLADIAAWQGKFNEAAKLFVSEGQLEKVRDHFVFITAAAVPLASHTALAHMLSRRTIFITYVCLQRAQQLH